MRLMLLAISITFLVGCQKEIIADVPDNTTDSTATGELLTKVVMKDGTDSAVSLYSYDKNKRLISIITTSTYSSDEFTFINRNNNGLIKSILYKGWSPILNDDDTLQVVVNSNQITKQYTSSVLNYKLNGDAIYDSTLYFFNNSGKIISDSTLRQTGANFKPTQKTLYTYTAGNLT